LVSPRLHSENSEGQDFCAYQQHRGNHQAFGAAGKILNFCIRTTVGKHPDENRQNELCGEKRNPGLRHGFRHLLIDQVPVGRDVLWRLPGVSQDGNRGKDRDYDDGDRKEFRHDALATPVSARLHELVSRLITRLVAEDKPQMPGQR